MISALESALAFASAFSAVIRRFGAGIDANSVPTVALTVSRYRRRGDADRVIERHVCEFLAQPRLPRRMARHFETHICQRCAGGVSAADERAGNLVDNGVVGQRCLAFGRVAGDKLRDGQP
jgi:hypothetical protein